MNFSPINPDFRRELVAACGSYGLLLRETQIEQLWRHFELACEANKRFNLTRITEPAVAAVQHYADSLTLLAWLAKAGAQPRRAIDIGTGGGWPAVPLAILLPDVAWTAIDSTGKKARFVAEAAEAIGLRNLRAEQARANEYDARPDRFDLAVARAVGKLADLVAEAHRLVAPGGHLVCYKTAHLSDEERDAGRSAAEKYHLAPLPDFPLTMRSGETTYERLLIAYRR